MSATDPDRPLDRPIHGKPLPFMYRNNWEVMLFFDVDSSLLRKSSRNVCHYLLMQVQNHRHGILGPDPLSDVPEGCHRLAIQFHMMDLPFPREYTNPEAIYACISGHLRAFAEGYTQTTTQFSRIEVRREWRFLSTVIFGVYVVSYNFRRLRDMRENWGDCF